jgi:hypothetical protein
MDNIAGTVPYLVLESSAADRCPTFPHPSSNPCLILLEISFVFYGIFVSWLNGFRPACICSVSNIVAGMGKREMHTGVWWQQCDLVGVDGMIILNVVFKK